MTILRSWREQKIMLKRRFPILNDEDFTFEEGSKETEEGSKETMLKRLETKLNKSKAELESLFAELQLY